MTESMTDDRIYSLMLKQQNHREKHNSLFLTEKNITVTLIGINL